MAITLPSRDPGVTALIVLPDTRAQLRAKLAAETHARREAERALEVALWQVHRQEQALSAALDFIDTVTRAWAKTIRPSTAERRAHIWAAKGTVLADRVSVVFAERAAAGQNATERKVR